MSNEIETVEPAVFLFLDGCTHGVTRLKLTYTEGEKAGQVVEGVYRGYNALNVIIKMTDVDFLMPVYLPSAIVEKA